MCLSMKSGSICHTFSKISNTCITIYAICAAKFHANIQTQMSSISNTVSS